MKDCIRCRSQIPAMLYCTSIEPMFLSTSGSELLWQWEEMETDCIVPSPNSLSQQPHLSSPSGTMLLEAWVSSRKRDKWVEMQRRKTMRGGWIKVHSQSHESGIKCWQRERTQWTSVTIKIYCRILQQVSQRSKPWRQKGDICYQHYRFKCPCCQMKSMWKAGQNEEGESKLHTKTSKQCRDQNQLDLISSVCCGNIILLSANTSQNNLTLFHAKQLMHTVNCK